MKLLGTMKIENDELYIGGVSTTNLRNNFGTPLYVIDEELLREKCRKYYKSFVGTDGINRVAYAGKAFLTIAMCELINEEGLNLDVVSGGELFTAYKSGFPMDKVLYHGNNKTIEEIKMGIELRVGRFVVDNFYEIEKINAIAKENNIIQKIFLRITPGIEAHTHEYIKTGQIDSKFGFTIINDDAISAVKKAIQLTNIELAGLHAHIGSQIFEVKPYEDEVDVMLNLIKDIKEITGYEVKELDLGGGFGIFYKDGDEPKKIEDFCGVILKRAKEKAKELNINLPSLIIEPGRSIIGNAGTTLYTIGSIKNIPQVRKYVSVDGGMTDNIRPSLYNAEYQCGIANKMNKAPNEKVTIAGKCCESGDILLTDIDIPEAESGDVLAVTSTGAYGYSMASNYNKIPKAAVVFVSNCNAKLTCRRQTYEQLIENELNL
jgi:diaminopimelate decarboxylase